MQGREHSNDSNNLSLAGMLKVALVSGLVSLVFLGLLAIAALAAWHYDSRHAYNAVSVPGNQVVEALEKYRSEYRRYPGALSQISPRYLSSIPPPRWGARKWEYVRYGVDSFRLQVMYDDDATYGTGYLTFGRDPKSQKIVWLKDDSLVRI